MFDYLQRPAEHLVLHGYRCWTRGIALSSRTPLIEAEALYGDLLGARTGRAALDALAEFVATTGLCARCPLRMLRPGTPALCRDEAMVLGLMSGLQNGNDAATRFCTIALADDRGAGQVGAAAMTYAMMLKASGRTLLPVPVEVLRGVETIASGQELQRPVDSTLH